MAKTLFGCLVMAMLGVTGYFLVADTRDPASVGIPNVTETHRSCSNGKKCCSEGTDCTAAKDETKCCDSKDAKCCDSKDGKCCSGEKKDDAKCCEGKGECKGEKCSGEKKDDAKCCEGKGECKGEKCTGEKKE